MDKITGNLLLATSFKKGRFVRLHELILRDFMPILISFLDYEFQRVYIKNLFLILQNLLSFLSSSNVISHFFIMSNCDFVLFVR